MPGSNHISRRDFIKLMTFGVGGVIVAGVGLPAIDFLIDPALKAGNSDAWIPLGPLKNFEVGKPALVNFTRSKVNGWEKTVNSYGVFVLRKADSSDVADVLVLSNRCTHLSCRVNWNQDRQEYICPCHDAQFDAGGKVLGGPPPRPLDVYAIKIENVNETETLYLHFLEG
jgi:Rieske Fe-S protein